MLNEDWKNVNEKLADHALADGPASADPEHEQIIQHVTQQLAKHPFFGPRLTGGTAPAAGGDPEFDKAQKLAKLSRTIGTVGNAFQNVTERPQPLADYAQRLAGAAPTPMRRDDSNDRMIADATQPLVDLQMKRQADAQTLEKDPNSASSQLARSFLSRYLDPALLEGKSHAELAAVFPFVKELIPAQAHVQGAQIAADETRAEKDRTEKLKKDETEGLRQTLLGPEYADSLAHASVSRNDILHRSDEGLKALKSRLDDIAHNQATTDAATINREGQIEAAKVAQQNKRDDKADETEKEVRTLQPKLQRVRETFGKLSSDDGLWGDATRIIKTATGFDEGTPLQAQMLELAESLPRLNTGSVPRENQIELWKSRIKAARTKEQFEGLWTELEAALQDSNRAANEMRQPPERRAGLSGTPPVPTSIPVREPAPPAAQHPPVKGKDGKTYRWNGHAYEQVE